MTKFWRIWAKSLGYKISDDEKESDAAAWFRTFFILQAFVTNLFIIAGIIRHWSKI